MNLVSEKRALDDLMSNCLVIVLLVCARSFDSMNVVRGLKGLVLTRVSWRQYDSVVVHVHEVY